MSTCQSGGLVLSLRTIVVSLAVGTLVAVLASLRGGVPRHPRRADRGRPRARSCPPRASRTTRSTSAIVGALALALFSYGVFGSGLEIKVRIVSLVLGVLLMFVSVAMIASRVVRPLAFVLGAPAARFGGAAGMLARQNAVRNPARTASTAAAVMVGLALITFVAVIGQGFSRSRARSASCSLPTSPCRRGADAGALTQGGGEGGGRGPRCPRGLRAALQRGEGGQGYGFRDRRRRERYAGGRHRLVRWLEQRSHPARPGGCDS